MGHPVQEGEAMTCDQSDYDKVIDSITNQVWADIELDVRNEPLLLDMWAKKIFPNWPSARLAFRRLVRARIDEVKP
jgi:hypothetical protein